MIVHFDSFERKMINHLPQLPRILIWHWAAACYSCGWFYPAAGYELRLSRVPAAGCKLRLSRDPTAGYKLRLTPTCDWLEFRRLDTGCGQLRQTADLSSGGWIRVTVDYILRLTRVPAAGYDLRLIPSCGWLELRRLDTSCSWFYPAADSSFILQYIK